MKKNKLFGYIMTGALSLGMIGGAGIPALAASNSTANSTAAVEQALNVKASLDEDTKQKVQAIMDGLKAQLADLGVELPTGGEKDPHRDLFASLDNEGKEKAETIMEQLRNNSITHEEAQAQLDELGVALPKKGERGPRSDLFARLDEETKQKVENIMEQLRNDSITHEKAQTQLDELGVEPSVKGPHRDMIAGLDEETKQKVENIMEQLRNDSITHEKAQTQLDELGVEPSVKGPHRDMIAGLDEETKQNAENIMEQLRNDSITHEEAQAQLAELGVEPPVKGKQGSHGDIFAGLDDESKQKAQELLEKARAQFAELEINHPHLPFKDLKAPTNEV